jgi:tetratricopeptide (TPR) repeat protein
MAKIGNSNSAIVREVGLCLCLALLVVSCSLRQSDNEKLLQVERIMDNNPHQALEKLNNVNALQLNDSADSALYRLLYVQAVHKVGSFYSNDFSLLKSISYFKESHDKVRLCKALLHQGINYYHENSYTDALLYLKRAESMARDIDDNAINHDVSEALGQINNDAGCYKLAMRYYRDMLDYSEKSGNINWTALSLNELATAYEREDKTDSFRICMNRCLKLLSRTDYDTKNIICTNIGDLYLKQGYRDKAKAYLMRTEVTTKDFKSAKLLGDIFASERNYDNAYSFWYEAANSDVADVKLPAIDSLIVHFKRQHKDEAVMFLYQLSNSYLKNHNVLVHPDEVSALQMKFDREKAERQTFMNIIYLLSAVIILVVILVVIVVYHRMMVKSFHNIIKLKDKKINELNNRYLKDLEAYKDAKDELRRLSKEKSDNDNLVSEKMNEIAALQKKLSEYQEDKETPDKWDIDDALINSDSVYLFHRLASKGKAPSDAEWQELHTLMSQHLQGFVNRLNGVKTISQREINVSILIKLRFIPSEIAALVDCSPQAVTNTRVRLLQKIFGENGGARDFDARIYDM